jgi:hypothetical protein
VRPKGTIATGPNVLTCRCPGNAHADERARVGSTRPGHILIAPSGQLVVPRLARIDSPPSSVEARPSEPPHAEYRTDDQERDFEYGDHVATPLPEGHQGTRIPRRASTSWHGLIFRFPTHTHADARVLDQAAADRTHESSDTAISTRPDITTAREEEDQLPPPLWTHGLDGAHHCRSRHEHPYSSRARARAVIPNRVHSHAAECSLLQRPKAQYLAPQESAVT